MAAGLLCRRASVFVFIVSLCGNGCMHRPRVCAPLELLRPEQHIDVNAEPGESKPTDRRLFDVLTSQLADDESDGQDETDRRKYNILALSGGGSNGAFTAGVLNGWTATGTRPDFDIVTGISTGALIATFAFLGPQYDAKVRQFYTTISSDDIYKKRPKLAVLWSESAATSDPLKQLIDSRVTRRMFHQVAHAHACGRRLYIGTTNLDTGRLVIWDMGAIASGGRPNSLELYRKIVLASTSVPGFLPPVPIDVTVNGRKYTELHADGGTTSEVFLRTSMLDLDPNTNTPGRKLLAGSHVYIIVAGKTFPDPKCTKPRMIGIASNALSALTSAHTRNDLVRIYTLSLLTGMEFHVAAIPEEIPISGNSMSFEPRAMRRLYEQGYRLACTGKAWQDAPPVAEPSEQSVPRAGTEFLSPYEARSGTAYRGGGT